MKLPTQLIAVSALTLAMSSAFAADSVTLRVTGTLIAPSCEVEMPGGDTADFGNIDRDGLNKATSTALSSAKDLTVRVDCGEAATAVSIYTTDSMVDSKPTDSRSFTFTDGTVSLESANYYGLGKASNNNPIGAYAVRVGKISVDGTEHDVQISADNKAWNPAVGSVYFNTDTPYLSAGSAVTGKIFNFPVAVAANISAADDLPSDEVVLNGNATIAVDYL